MNVTLKQLEAFLAVKNTLSFSQAATLVNLSQPALSANILRLEELVGARLFDRDTRTVSLSVVGKEFVQVASGALEHLDRGMTRIRDMVAGKRGQLSIAVVPSVAAGVLPDILVRYKAGYPDIELRIHDRLSNGCIEMLRSGAADVALMPERPHADDLLQQLLFHDPLVVLCSLSHPLAHRRDLTWPDIIQCDLIVRSNDSSVRQTLETQYRLAGTVLRPAFEVEHVGTVLGLIVAGLGIAVLPASVMYMVNMSGLACCHFHADSIPYWTICASTARGRSSAPVVAPFLRLCKEHLLAQVPT